MRNYDPYNRPPARGDALGMMIAILFMIFLAVALLLGAVVAFA